MTVSKLFSYRVETYIFGKKHRKSESEQARERESEEERERMNENTDESVTI